jgi:hypothetical protein
MVLLLLIAAVASAPVAVTSTEGWYTPIPGGAQYLPCTLVQSPSIRRAVQHHARGAAVRRLLTHPPARQLFELPSHRHRIPKSCNLVSLPCHALARVWPAADFDDPPMIAIEAENMTKVSGEWLTGDWGHAPTRFAATVANTFASRRAVLHAPAGVGAESVASSTFRVSVAGSYHVLLRYEAAYLFETPVKLEIRASSTSSAAQPNAAPVFSRTYGERHSLKVQGFGKARLSNASMIGQGSMCGQGRPPY